MKNRSSNYMDANIYDPSQWGLSNLLENHKRLIQGITQVSQTQIPENYIESYLIKIFTTKNQSQIDFDQKFFKKRLVLKNLIKEQKKKAIVKNFRLKAIRNLTNSRPFIFEPFEKENEGVLGSLNAISLPTWLNLLFSGIYILETLFFLFFSTLSLVFGDQEFRPLMQGIKIAGICIYSTEILFNLIEIQTNKGRRITKMKEVVWRYLKNQFTVDFVIILLIVLDLAIIHESFRYLRCSIILKIGQSLRKLQNIENYFINNFYKEQYWGLSKVFLINFLYAHCLAILLIAMGFLSQHNSWLHKIGIENQPWFQKYAWSYYWGTTTMLTIGFGDISPANYQQAICLTIIETISCILLAYNINCVGTLIHNIRSQDKQKNESLKTMRRLAKENEISEDLEWKVCNYISESDKMRKKFKFQKDKEFISALPEELKVQYLKEANRNMFENLVFFKSLTEKTLLTLAEHIEVKIAHPEQIIFKREEKKQILILRNGLVGYCTKIQGSMFNETAVDKISVEKGETDRLLHLHFFNCEENINYIIKSLKYSVISLIDLKTAIDIMKKTSSYDFENYCEVRDRSKHILDEFQTIECENCETKHSKMKCPKLHYCPIKQLVIYKQLKKLSIGRNDRTKIERQKSIHWSFWKPLSKYNTELKTMEIKLYGTTMKQSKKKKRVVILKDSFQKMIPKIEGQQLQHSVPSLSLRKEPYYRNKTALQILELKKIMERRFSSLFKHTAGLQGFPSSKEFNIEVDEMHDFRYYCTSHNPKNIEINFASRTKSKKVLV